MCTRGEQQTGMAQVAQINPRLLAWARETAGLSPEEAAAKLGLKSTAKATAAEKLRQVESGERVVTQGMLEKASAAYRRPLVTFYLPHPPARGERGEDFRTVVGAASARGDAMLDALIRDVRARQQMLREALLDDEDTQPLEFVASCRMGDGAQEVASQIRSKLGIATAEQKKARDPAALFTLLRTAAEKAGIFVLLLGDLGSYHSDVGEDVFGVVIYRFLLNGWISDQLATEMFRAFADRWQLERQRARDARESDEIGPGYYIVRRSRLGFGLLDTVRRALQSDVLTHTKAARILGVAPTAVHPLLRERQRPA
jgi:transcriptional regulator with XRE-family HTH domain